MRRFDRALRSVNNDHKQENYAGPLASTTSGGHSGNVNNLYNSQVRDAMMFLPYGLSSRPISGMKAQAVVNDNSDHGIVGVYDPMRPAVKVGETCLYSSANTSIFLSIEGNISIETNGANVDLRKSGAIDMYNKNGHVNIDKDGNIGIMNKDKYSIVVGQYEDEKLGDGEDEDTGAKDDEEDEGDAELSGIKIKTGKLKATLDGKTNELKILQDKKTGITISEESEISIFKDETDVTITITEDNDIKMVVNEVTGMDITHEDDIKLYNENTSISVSNEGDIEIGEEDNIIRIDKSGDIEIKTSTNINIESTGDIEVASEGNINVNTTGTTSIESTGDIKANTSGDINFECNKFIVNGEEMIIP